MRQPLLRVQGLEVSFASPDGEVPAVREVSFDLEAGRTLGLVGESGCGKSVTALSILGLIPPPGRIRSGSVCLEGRELTALGPREWRGVRGREIGMVFQEPMTSLNPVFTVGYQLAEALTAHGRMPRGELRRRCIELLEAVGIGEPEARLKAYPGQLSGGLRQRVMIAIALACRPKLLIADEPTTALDVTVQAQIMALLRQLRAELGTALLLITHDLGLVAQNVEQVLVMYAGYVMEQASTAALFAEPLHPYTQGLLGSLPGAAGVSRGGRLRAIPGNVPHPLQIPAGCPFRDRCPRAAAPCAEGVPALEEKAPGHQARCVRVPPRV
ncbi:MAG: ABC transporter ATP-binding protein [Deferrisomatales bacterium]